jgi:hypothetical protein
MLHNLIILSILLVSWILNADIFSMFHMLTEGFNGFRYFPYVTSGSYE